VSSIPHIGHTRTKKNTHTHPLALVLLAYVSSSVTVAAGHLLEATPTSTTLVPAALVIEGDKAMCETVFINLGGWGGGYSRAHSMAYLRQRKTKPGTKYAKTPAVAEMIGKSREGCVGRGT